MRPARKLIALLLALVLCAGFLGGSALTDAGSGPAPAPPAGPLAGLEATIEPLLKEWNTPGVAVGVVHKGEVIFARGFGQRELEAGLPVTPDTVFAIGSTTKAFTALAFQILAEEGLLNWDQPVRDVLPGFRLYDSFATERATARDWALHRVGLSRHDIPFLFNPDLDARAFVANLRYLRPMYEFRTRYSYDNIGYIVLGQMLEQATGRPWSEVIASRILAPLGMTQTSFTVDALREAPDHAAPYIELDGKVTPTSFSPTTAVGAAGAMNASLTDLLKWVQFQLGQGKAGGRQVVSQSGLGETQSAQITVPGGPGSQSSYGLGWKIESYRGHHMVSHSGNTLGSASQITLFPAEQVGIVVLSNVPYSLAMPVITQTVADRLLGLEATDWSAVYRQMLGAQTPPAGAAPSSPASSGPARDLSDYAGEYRHPAYGRLLVRRAGEGLEAVYYTTTIPLRHKHYDQFSGPLSPLQPLNVAFRFVTAASGAIDEVIVDFDGLGNEQTFTRVPDAGLQDPAYLKRLAGTYSLGGSPVEVVLVGNELVLRLPGQPAYPLVPIGPARFHLKGMPTLTMGFTLSDDGARAVWAWLSESEQVFELERLD